MKRFFLFLAAVIISVNLFIIISGKTYLYKAFWCTYMRGRSTVDIDNYVFFENRTVQKGVYQPWNISSQYNKTKIPKNCLEELIKFKSIAFLIIKNDSIIHEQYWEGYDYNSLSNSFSMAKSVVSMLIGVAIDEGKIKSENQYVRDFLPEFNQGLKSKITIKHLLTMSSGIEFDESQKDPFAYTAEAYFGEDLVSTTMKYNPNEEPGKVFKYLSGNTEILGLILEKATGKSLSEYASEKLWKPIGASSDALWSLDKKEGHEKAYCCFYSNARDFARIGKLYLDSGKWNGNALVSKDYVLRSLTPAELVYEDGRKNAKYGYQWWLMPHYKGYSIYCMRGILGQYVICIPDQNMIIVRLGHKRDEIDYEGHPIDLKKYIDGALEMYGG